MRKIVSFSFSADDLEPEFVRDLRKYTQITIRPSVELEALAGILPPGEIKYVPPPIRPLAEVEREAIIRTLRHFNGNRTHTAKALQISIRTLRNKLQEYRELGIDLL